MDNNFNWIFKPSDSLSSQGISIAKCELEQKEAFGFAYSFSESKTVICEEYIIGSLHDINGIITKDKFYPLGINDKKAGPPPRAVVVEGSAPTSLSVEKQKILYNLFEKACRSVGLSYGQVKGDSILSENGSFYIMEVAPRLHGPLGSIYLLPNAIKINPFKELIHFYLNKTVNIHNPLKKFKKNVTVEAVDKKPTIENEKIIKILEKEGLYDKIKWESNNDVPFYLVKNE